MSTVSSALDPLKIYVSDGINPYDPCCNVIGKTPASFSLADGKRTVVLVLMGQSNQGGHNLETYAPASPQIFNFNYLNGGMYVAANPILGCTSFDASYVAPYNSGAYGHHALRTADKLIAAGKADRVILAPMAVGSSLTSYWAAGGINSSRIGVMAQRLALAGLLPAPAGVTMFILQNLGEADANAAIPQVNGTTNRMSIIAQFRAAGLTCPFFEALCTFNGTTVNLPAASVSAVRGSQQAVVDNVSVFPGADTDTITAATDRDGPHFTASGSDKHSTLWANILTQHL